MIKKRKNEDEINTEIKSKKELKYYFFKISEDEFYIKDGIIFLILGYIFPKPYEYIFKNKIPKENIGTDLSKFLNDNYKLDEIYCKVIIKNKLIKINNKIIEDPDYKLKKNDSNITYTEKYRMEPPCIYTKKVELIYEDEDLFVINKPS
jgi:hypothetical protein